MVNYCLVIDGLIVKGPTSLPSIYLDESTNQQISGFNNLDNETLAKYGWLPVSINDSGYGEYSVFVNSTYEVEENQVLQRNNYCILTREQFEERERLLAPEPINEES
jgi:hypothetical protein